jgi:hypothetical protein
MSRMTKTALESLFFTPENLEIVFRETLLENGALATDLALKKINTFWSGLKLHLDAQPYLGLSHCAKSLNMVPFPARKDCFYFNVGIVGFLMQRHGPEDNSKYIEYFSNQLKLRQFTISTLQSCAQARFHFAPPKFTPESLVYDLNWVKLAFDYESFQENQRVSVFEQNNTLKPELVIARRRILWKSFIDRGKVFLTPGMESLNQTAFENIERFVAEHEPSRFSDDATYNKLLDLTCTAK